MVNCVDCHLPPKDDTWAHYTAKAALGIRDVWGYLTKDSADFDWDRKSELEHAIKYIPNASCVKCHQNLFPQGITDDGITDIGKHIDFQNLDACNQEDQINDNIYNVSCDL